MYNVKKLGFYSLIIIVNAVSIWCTIWILVYIFNQFMNKG